MTYTHVHPNGAREAYVSRDDFLRTQAIAMMALIRSSGTDLPDLSPAIVWETTATLDDRPYEPHPCGCREYDGWSDDSDCDGRIGCPLADEFYG